LKIVQHISLQQAGIGGNLTHDYFSAPDKLKDFFTYQPDLKGLVQAANDRKNFPVDRKTLVDVINGQYKGLKLSAPLKENIQALTDENTFTITTGHQLNLFTGPLYFIYKIASAITLAQKLDEADPTKKFVPVYWMNSEDHDFKEINHFFLDNKKWEWEVIASSYGPTGRMALTGMKPLLDKIEAGFSEKYRFDPAFKNMLEAYRNSPDLSSAHRKIVHYLFNEYGVIILDQDSTELKKSFSGMIEKEILGKPSIEPISNTNEKLEQSGYKPQVFTRDINYFYTGNETRERIIEHDGGYATADLKLKWSKEELLAELRTNPVFFSPNVVTRPLYQEFVLPNVAYIGGPAEIAYWLQYRSNFAGYGIFYPTLILRDCFLLLTEKQLKKIQSLGLTLEDFFTDLDSIIRKFIQQNFKEELDLSEIESGFNKLHDSILKRITDIDPSMDQMALALKARSEKDLKKIASKINKALREKNTRDLDHIKSIYATISPLNHLQERQDNLFDHTLSSADFIAKIVGMADPLVSDLKVIGE